MCVDFIVLYCLRERLSRIFSEILSLLVRASCKKSKDSDRKHVLMRLVLNTYQDCKNGIQELMQAFQIKSVDYI